MSEPLMTELNAALASATMPRRSSILTQVAELFFARAELYSIEQTVVFDSVLLMLIKGADDDALAEISRKIAMVSNAPAKALAALARHDNIAISGPIIEKSAALPDDVLLEIANDGSSRSLQALAGRTHISERVTDVLIERNNVQIVRKLIMNPGARLSELSFVKLVSQAKDDDVLATAISARADLPDELKPFLMLAIKPDSSS